MRKALSALAVVFLLAHLPFLPQTLDDIDAINFALAVRDFDVTQHQPHPPGYPVFIAMSKVSTAVLGAVGIAAIEARGLAIWSALCGVLMIPALFALFRALDGSVRRAWWATLLTMAAPLVWFSALRPLSDIAGLAVTILAQALLVRAITPAPSHRHLLAGALTAGLAIGIRSQSFTLTLPLLLLALVMPGLAASHRSRLQGLGAFALGVLAWGVPLLVASGGPAAYLAALGQQGGEDFGGVVMFWNFPTLAVGLSALQHTFVTPWASPVLAGIALLAACAGIAALLRERRLALITGALAVPYALFHLLFHETVTVRYALPLVPVLAWLAVRGVDRFARSAMPLVITALTIWCLVHAVPAGIAYASVETPIFRAMADLSAARLDGAPIVASHRRIFTESRRARTWLGESPAGWLPAPRAFEWLELTRAWREGSVAPAWFFADPSRTDLALIDARNAKVVQYRWPFDHRVYVGGARPGVFDVHIYDEPEWFLEEGWALTPETAGIAVREGWMPHVRPSVGWIRRRSGAVQVVLGGRHLGGPGDPPIQVLARVDGKTVLDTEVLPGFFVDRVTLPPGSLAGDGTYARLEVTTRLVGGGAARVDLEQFDAQPDGVPMFAVDRGWYEPEFQPDEGLSWRWMSRQAELWVRPVGKDVNLVITGESPLKYFDRSSVLRVTMDGQEISRLSPSDDFTWAVTLPADKLASADGRVLLESDQSFVPGGEAGGDQRSLAIRVYRITVN